MTNRDWIDEYDIDDESKEFIIRPFIDYHTALPHAATVEYKLAPIGFIDMEKAGTTDVDKLHEYWLDQKSILDLNPNERIFIISLYAAERFEKIWIDRKHYYNADTIYLLTMDLPDKRRIWFDTRVFAPTMNFEVMGFKTHYDIYSLGIIQ